MKKSTYVPLVLLGWAVGLTSCTEYPDEPATQRSYSSLQDCKKDWDEADCSTSDATGHSSGAYYGPRYYWDRNEQRPIAINNDGTHTPIRNSHLSNEFSGGGRATTSAHVSRGGFGSTAHGFSGGG